MSDIKVEKDKSNKTKEAHATKGINTSIDYDFNNDPNKNVNDISDSDKVMYYKTKANNEEENRLTKSKLETNNQVDSEGDLVPDIDADNSNDLNQNDFKKTVESEKVKTKESFNKEERKGMKNNIISISNNDKEKEKESIAIDKLKIEEVNENKNLLSKRELVEIETKIDNKQSNKNKIINYKIII